jgi:hypothetical protein
MTTFQQPPKNLGQLSRLPINATLIAAFIMSAGCGSGDGLPSTSPSTSPSATPSTTPASTPAATPAAAAPGPAPASNTTSICDNVVSSDSASEPANANFTETRIWKNFQQIPNSGFKDFSFGFDNNNRGLAIIQSGPNGSSQLQSLRLDPLTGWGALETLGNTSSNVPRSKINVAGDGSAFSIYDSGSGVRSSLYTVGSGWAATPSLVSTPTALNAEIPYSLESNVSGKRVAIWTNIESASIRLWVNTFDPATGWAIATKLDNRTTGVSDPKVAIDAAGNAIAVWNLRRTSTDLDVWASRFQPATGWSTPQQISTVPAGTNATEIQVALDQTGNGVAVWRITGAPRGASIKAARFSATTGWSPEEIIQTPCDFTGNSPRLAMNLAGKAVLTWDENNFTTNLRRRIVRTFDTANGWGDFKVVATGETGGSSDVSVAIDLQGNAMIAWAGVGAALRSSSLMALRYQPTVGWSTPRKLIEPTNELVVSDVSVKMNALGNAMVTWKHPPITGELSQTFYRSAEYR